MRAGGRGGRDLGLKPVEKEKVEYKYSVVEYKDGVGVVLVSTDSLAHARQEVLKFIRIQNKTIFILRNDTD